MVLTQHTVTVQTMEHRQDAPVEVDGRVWTPWVYDVSLNYADGRGELEPGHWLYITLAKREKVPTKNLGLILYVVRITGSWLKPASLWILAVEGYLPPYPGDLPEIWG